MKTCKECKTEQPDTNFNFEAYSRSLRKNTCKTCVLAYSNERNRAKSLERQAKKQEWLDMAMQSKNRLLSR
jgi:hypothetical protein